MLENNIVILLTNDRHMNDLEKKILIITISRDFIEFLKANGYEKYYTAYLLRNAKSTTLFKLEDEKVTVEYTFQDGDRFFEDSFSIDKDKMIELHSNSNIYKFLIDEIKDKIFLTRINDYLISVEKFIPREIGNEIIYEREDLKEEKFILKIDSKTFLIDCEREPCVKGHLEIFSNVVDEQSWKVVENLRNFIKEDFN